MSTPSRLSVFAITLIAFLNSSQLANAVILYGGTVGRNLSAPSGAFADSGWQFQGAWQNGAGTAIGTNWFVTAKHLGGAIGDSFVQDGTSYTASAVFDDPDGSDLRLIQIQQQFTSFAQLYTKTDELASGGKILSVFGRGTDRGADVTGPEGNQGYAYGVADGLMSWGASQTSVVTSFSDLKGDFLGGTFSIAHSSSIPTSVTLSSGDSGGGVFIKDVDGDWKLAGVNYGVDGPFSTDVTFTNSFNAAMYDMRGFYLGDSSNYNFFPTALAQPVGQNWYATRISTKATFIFDTIGVVPEPASLIQFCIGLGGLKYVLSRRKRFVTKA